MILQENLKEILSKGHSNIVEGDLEEAIDHGILVSKLAVLLSKNLGMNHEFCYGMAQAGLLHDIGKLRLGRYLYGRNKDSLVVEEMKYVRMHPSLGYSILIEHEYNDDIAKAVLHHHENYDGSGYPENIKGDRIPLGARILRICDVFAALISERRYRSAFDVDSAIELMIDEVKNFDMEIFLILLQTVHSDQINEILDFVAVINNKHSFETTLGK